MNLEKTYKGYNQVKKLEYDKLISHTDHGTPAGEYLRRYWHPVALSSEITNTPLELRILGEDLVIFKTKENKVGLVHKHCTHRRASLVFGKTESKGIRCCYHGWLFSPDGEILETPGEDPQSKQAKFVREKFKLGAYPIKEFKGIVFAFLGPPKKIPEFPYYDVYETPYTKRSPYKIKYNCNWIQVLDAIMDPVHTSFLHGQSSGIQFSEGFGEVGEIDFFERGNQYLGANIRRIDDNVWIRINELILPNFTQAGSAFAADGTKTKYFGRSSFTRWVVPVDDHHCVAIAWANFGERGDPIEYDNKEGYERIEAGEIIDRSFEEKQKSPGDAEAVESMGSISTHRGEHLMETDYGIMAYRKHIRKSINELQDGIDPMQPKKNGDLIKTYGQDTILRVPKRNIDDRKFIKSIGSRVMNLQFDSEQMPNKDRDTFIINELSKLEKSGTF